MGNKFGAFKGVFVPSILTILGVILFLRLGWIVGQAGLVSTIVIISLSSVITFLTGLSISAAATNTRVGAGGSYFLISRCFGLEVGAAIGLPLYLAQALGITFYLVGFAESLSLMFPGLSIPLVAFVTLVLLTILTLVSSEIALKTQIFIFTVIICALLSFLFGDPIETTSNDLGLKTVGPLGFWAIFAVFFPAVTGIEAGVSLSGDLKSPDKALPLGTLAAVLVGFICYVGFAYKFSVSAPTSELINNQLLMRDIALFGFLFYLGLWGATLSSTMGALLGAPRTMQALAKDRILPQFLAKGKEKTNDPQRATLVSFVIAGFGLLLGDLNTIATLLSMFFLTSYGALNLVAGIEGLLGNPTWRPTFRAPWILSMIGALMCFGAMFMIDSGFSFVAFALILLVFFVMRRRRLRSNYSDIRSGLTLRIAREFIYQFDSLKIDSRNWRPHFLVLCGSPQKRLYLIDFAYRISKGRGFITTASVLEEEDLDTNRIQSIERTTKEYLAKKNLPVLAKAIQANNFNEGVNSLLQAYGIGQISPNTLLLGNSNRGEATSRFIQIILDCYKYKKNILVLKTPSDFDANSVLRGKKIDVWWRGRKKGNLSFLLTLAYMLQMSKEWQGAQLSLKSVVQSSQSKEEVLQDIKTFKQSCRIQFEYEVLIDAEKDPFSLIEENSKNSDLVFLGLASPEEENDYTNYYKSLIEKTKGLNNLVFALQVEDVEFSKIFK